MSTSMIDLTLRNRRSYLKMDKTIPIININKLEDHMKKSLQLVFSVYIYPFIDSLIINI
jgi:hypothetical protein